MCEENELPREAALREAIEVNQKLRITKIIHEDSQSDSKVTLFFTRLAYAGDFEEFVILYRL